MRGGCWPLVALGRTLRPAGRFIMLILDLGRQDIGGKFLGQIDLIGNLPDHVRGAIVDVALTGDAVDHGAKTG